MKSNQPNSPVVDTSYVDLELYQNSIPVPINPNAGFNLTGPHGGLTVGDLKITLKYTGNSFTPVSYQQWQPGSTPRTFEYFSIIPPANTTQPAANNFKNRVPNGAFGWTFYEPMQYLINAIDLIPLIGGTRLPGKPDSLPFKTLLIKSKSPASNTYDLTSFSGPFKQFDENEIKFSIFSQTLVELNDSIPSLKESIVIVHNFDVVRLRNILNNVHIDVKENKLAASIIQTRDNINAVFYYKHKKKLLLLNEERNLLDFFESANTEEEFSHRVASLGQVSQHLNVEILRSLTHETNNEIKSIQLLDEFLTEIGKQSKEITETLRNLSRVRQGYPIHTDISGNIAALDYFGISYPVKDYESAWQSLLNSYYLALNKLYLILEELYIKNRK